MGKNYGRKRKKRSVDTRDQNPKILIVCEGEKTEPNYFKAFRIPTKKVKVIPAGMVHDRVVEEAIRLKGELQAEIAWAVFDSDDNNDPKIKQNIQRAFEIAANNNINIAFSNEAFELWYILHYDYLDSGISRNDYCTILTKKRINGNKYEKNDPTMYDFLLDKQSTAIRNSKRLFEQCVNKQNYYREKPITSVFELVEELNKLI